MALVLQQLNLPAHSRLARQTVFDQQGGSIGAQENSACYLPSDTAEVQPLHALLHYQNGQYLLTDLSDDVWINDHQQALGKGNVHALENGDIVRMGDYVLEALVDDEEMDASLDLAGLQISQQQMDEAPHPTEGDPIDLNHLLDDSTSEKYGKNFAQTGLLQGNERQLHGLNTSQDSLYQTVSGVSQWDIDQFLSGQQHAPLFTASASSIDNNQWRPEENTHTSSALDHWWEDSTDFPNEERVVEASASSSDLGIVAEQHPAIFVGDTQQVKQDEILTGQLQSNITQQLLPTDEASLTSPQQPAEVIEKMSQLLANAGQQMLGLMRDGGASVSSSPSSIRERKTTFEITQREAVSSHTQPHAMVNEHTVSFSQKISIQQADQLCHEAIDVLSPKSVDTAFMSAEKKLGFFKKLFSSKWQRYQRFQGAWYQKQQARIAMKLQQLTVQQPQPEVVTEPLLVENENKRKKKSSKRKKR